MQRLRIHQARRCRIGQRFALQKGTHVSLLQ